nr:hypothetical protein [Microbispora sp. NRRL B-24597]
MKLENDRCAGQPARYGGIDMAEEPVGMDDIKISGCSSDGSYRRRRSRYLAGDLSHRQVSGFPAGPKSRPRSHLEGQVPQSGFGPPLLQSSIRGTSQRHVDIHCLKWQGEIAEAVISANWFLRQRQRKNI